MEIPAGLAFQCSQIPFLSVWLKFHLAFLSIIKETYLCPELFSRRQTHVKFQGVYWISWCWATLQQRKPHLPFYRDGVNGVNGGVRCDHFQAEAAVLEMMDATPLLSLEKQGTLSCMVFSNERCKDRWILSAIFSLKHQGKLRAVPFTTPLPGTYVCVSLIESTWGAR